MMCSSLMNVLFHLIHKRNVLEGKQYAMLVSSRFKHGMVKASM